MGITFKMKFIYEVKKSNNEELIGKRFITKEKIFYPIDNILLFMRDNFNSYGIICRLVGVKK